MLHGLGVTEIIENLFKGVSGRMQFWKIIFEKYFNYFTQQQGHQNQIAAEVLKQVKLKILISFLDFLLHSTLISKTLTFFELKNNNTFPESPMFSGLDSTKLT